MLKKLLWAGGIFISFIIILLLGLSLFVRGYLKSDKLKSIIIPRIEELTGRKADIDQINVSIFKGIVVKGISLKEKDSIRDFITARELILDYSLVPLLKKQIVIKRIELIAPYIHVKKEKDGRYNFSDITEKFSGRGESPESGTGKEKGLPFTIIADRIHIGDARLEFTDDTKSLPDIAASADAEIVMSLGRSLKKITLSSHLNLKELKASVNGVQTNTTGGIEMKDESINLDLNTAIGKENVKLTGAVTNYQTAPVIKADIYARELDLDKLMPPVSKASTVKEESSVKEGSTKRGDAAGIKVRDKKVKAQDNKQQKADKSEGIKINASGEIRVESAKYKGYYIKDFKTNYQYKDGAINLEPLGMRLAGGEQVKAEGRLNGDLHFKYETESDDMSAGIKKTLSGKGELDLSKCEIKSSKITDAIAAFTGLDDLKSPRFESTQFHFSIRDQRVYLEGNMSSGLIKLDPRGNIGFDERMDILTDLKLSPALASRISTSKITGYLKDEKGWSVIPLKITGTTDKPSVGLNPAGVGKQIEKGIKEEIEKKLFKGIFGK